MHTLIIIVMLYSSGNTGRPALNKNGGGVTLRENCVVGREVGGLHGMETLFGMYFMKEEFKTSQHGKYEYVLECTCVLKGF